MQLVKKELEENRILLNSIATFVEEEHSFSEYIIQRQKNIDNIPADTLIKYQNIAFQTASLLYSSDAFEALKASALVSEIDNKDLAFQLIQIYKALEIRQENITGYYDQKLKTIDKLNNNEQFFNMRIYANMPIHELWKNYFKNFHFKSIIYTSNGYFSNRGLFINLANEITKIIATINKEYN